MKKITLIYFYSLFFIGFSLSAQETPTKQGHTNKNKFRQMKDLLATPNEQRLASGAPGSKYTQQKVDYVMDIVLDDENAKITGKEKITYHNNSEDTLEYLWVQLDQNMRASDSKTPDITPRVVQHK